jgi:spoIIIJ-associated protein
VKDRAFTGRDVADALRVAAETLGLPEQDLRYFVLDPGRPGSLGVAPSPARIAVLMQAPPPRREGAVPPPIKERPREEKVRAAEAEPDDDLDFEPEPLAERLSRVTEALTEALGFPVVGEVVEDRDAATVRVSLADPSFLLGPDGEGATARALEHVLHRSFVNDVSPRKLRVEFPGHRETRDQALQELALRLAAEVRSDHAPRETAPLNAYERRIVHMAVATAGGVVTESQGEGAERRVVLRPANDAGPGGEVF